MDDPHSPGNFGGAAPVTIMVPQTRRKILQSSGAAFLSTISGCAFDSDHRTTVDTDTTASPTRTESDTPQETIRPACFGEETTPEDSEGVWLGLRFGQTKTDSDGRAVSVKCDKLLLRGGTGHLIKEYDVGAPDQEPTFISGAYAPETEDGRSFRWFGKDVIVQFEEYPGFGSYGSVEAVLSPVRSPLEVAVCADGNYVTSLREDGWRQVVFSLHAAEWAKHPWTPS